MQQIQQNTRERITNPMFNILYYKPYVQYIVKFIVFKQLHGQNTGMRKNTRGIRGEYAGNTHRTRREYVENTQEIRREHARNTHGIRRFYDILNKGFAVEHRVCN